MEDVIEYNIYRIVYGGIPIYWNTMDGESNCTTYSKQDWLKFYHQIWCYGYRLCLWILKSVINMMWIEGMSYFSLSDKTQEKQKCIWCQQIFPSFWTIIQSGTFVIFGGCCLRKVFCQPLCVVVSGQESSKRVWKGWWGADVSEITRHAQPDTTHRHQTQERAWEGER